MQAHGTSLHCSTSSLCQPQSSVPPPISRPSCPNYSHRRHCSSRTHLHRGVQCRSTLPTADKEAIAASTAQTPLAAAVAAAAAPIPLPTSCIPEDLQLPPGELSPIDRSGKGLDVDVFRCFGCKKEECRGPTGCAANMWRFNLDGYLREILTARVYDVAVQTPLEEAKKLSDLMGNRILIKREDMQPVFSFKLRGAYNKMAKLPEEVRARGVITSSAGNHAQGVALAASRMGCKATICMPVNTPGIKVESVRKLGGTVELVGESYQETQAHAVSRSIAEGLAFVPPYDDPFTIAGQGTIGDEILRQVGDMDALDAIFVPVGGGGLIAGVAAYVKALKPHVKVIGVEPSGANAMALSLARGERVALSRVDAFADGVAVKQVGMETFRMCRELLDGIILVDNSAISAAIKDVFNETRSILEPAGAVGMAGAKAWLQRHNHKGKTVVAITSGANINFERLRLVAELANVGATTEATLVTTIPEQRGAFHKFISVATVHGAINVTEFKYRYSAGNTANVLWGAGIKVPEDLTGLLDRLNAASMPTVDISRLEVAQLHLRHLVGGRARSFTGSVPDEKIYQVIFPERPGALVRFLDAVCGTYNITLFHYRNTGNRESSVLMGLQVPPDQLEAFAAVKDGLQDTSEFSFKELESDVRQVFDQFIQ
uniref:Threonine dehydratase n=1 Tax=Dunaliella tertiolecta TaxID=3047 RepID=A0A7S3QRM5_DUNTE|mmetsp:Transcript_16582/g.45485  ORF Transcript_16582/g.45485 Transcript_16582/m.45485 type:complete len:659 (-) Transcript_16582:268-2244(-)